MWDWTLLEYEVFLARYVPVQSDFLINSLWEGLIVSPKEELSRLKLFLILILYFTLTQGFQL